MRIALRARPDTALPEGKGLPLCPEKSRLGAVRLHCPGAGRPLRIEPEHAEGAPNMPRILRNYLISFAIIALFFLAVHIINRMVAEDAKQPPPGPDASRQEAPAAPSR